jgi:hypothetical protein
MGRALAGSSDMNRRAFGAGLARRRHVNPQPTYRSVLDVAFAWHGIPLSRIGRETFPPAVRITLALLVRAIAHSRLAVYEASAVGPSSVNGRRILAACMEEVEELPGAFAAMHSTGNYDRATLSRYRLCMDDLFVWATGEDLERPAICVPSWAFLDRTTRATRRRKPRPGKAGQSPHTNELETVWTGR